MQQLITFARRAGVLPMAVASAALFALMVLTFCDVILRSTLNAPIEAATELTRIAIAVVVFSTLPILSARAGHITVDLADGLFDRLDIARWRDGLVHLACGVMLYWPTRQVVVLAERARGYGDQTEYLAIPTYLIEWFIALMTGITALVLVLKGLLTLIAPQALGDAHD